jgi:glucose-1-phosphate cytidylyltransferase
MVTLTTVRPSARFGDLEFDGDRVSSFQEKSQLHEGWINGGFFICEPEVFNFIDNDTQMFEREPLERIVEAGQLMAYKHHGFWHCMDTKRDRDLLESLWGKNALWKV